MQVEKKKQQQEYSSYILGISAHYHDSAAALITNNVVVAAAEEERFTRKKHDGSFPLNSIKYCLQHANISLEDIDYVVFYEKPLSRFERRIDTTSAYAPQGIDLYLKSFPIWLREKIYLETEIYNYLRQISKLPKSKLPKLLYNTHHRSHASSAFFPSPFEEAGVLCIDGAGEWATTSAWRGTKNKLDLLWELEFPHSLGFLYSAFTYYTGFKVDSGEYKLMGLAPYGEPKYVDLILEELIDIKPDGTFRLNMEYFSYPYSFEIINDKFCSLFRAPARNDESIISQFYMDIARSIQYVCEEIVLKLAYTMYKEVNQNYLCLAGGVALNCVANGKIIREVPFKDIWIQPAASDAGCAVGAALSVWYEYLQNDRTVSSKSDSMKGSYLGPSFSTNDAISMLAPYNAIYEEYNEPELLEKAALLLNDGAVLGWFQGRMEFGPRALGNRSILGDPRNPDMQYTMNMKIKYRESFRPFAPAIKKEKVNEFFSLEKESPYMLLVAELRSQYKININDNTKYSGLDKLKIKRSHFPAITHVDYSARIQTVDLEVNPRFYMLLDRFEKLTGCPMLINTSFNVRGEPIVCTPAEAYKCFMRTNMDYLIIDNLLFDKRKQPEWQLPYENLILD
jgi:carbamoyltransferase